MYYVKARIGILILIGYEQYIGIWQKYKILFNCLAKPLNCKAK